MEDAAAWLDYAEKALRPAQIAELEGARILFLARKGHKEQALECIAKRNAREGVSIAESTRNEILSAFLTGRHEMIQGKNLRPKDAFLAQDWPELQAFLAS